MATPGKGSLIEVRRWRREFLPSKKTSSCVAPFSGRFRMCIWKTLRAGRVLCGKPSGDPKNTYEKAFYRSVWPVFNPCFSLWARDGVHLPGAVERRRESGKRQLRPDVHAL